ncbi:hypothetical protein BHS04_30845 [Myxococcus xanthus]|nr:hypothetical protein BHS04_30845 [Myxococcus xanthus]
MLPTIRPPVVPLPVSSLAAQCQIHTLPPLLQGPMDCYFTQRPGYRLTERELRTVLYDHAYLRRTWRADKTGRAEEAISHRRAWEEGPMVGLGIRLGPFWYPAPMTVPPLEDTH